jgi:hypothetical protein
MMQVKTVVVNKSEVFAVKVTASSCPEHAVAALGVLSML